MSEIEFVNREAAEADALRAIALLDQSDSARVDAWFALQAAADWVGPQSNVGLRGISWTPGVRPGKGRYNIGATCRDGRVQTTMVAPNTLIKAQAPIALSKAIAMRTRLISEKGGLAEGLPRAKRYVDAVIQLLDGTQKGSAWLANYNLTMARRTIMEAVRVADSYGRDGVYARASLDAHYAFISFDDRVALIRAYPTIEASRAKAMSLRGGRRLLSNQGQRPSPSQITRLAVSSGVTTREARIILQALLNGRSKTKLIRAINEAARMVDSRGVLKAAA